ncbi:MAG TPA: hypothetical protein VFU88_00945 [Ktedonobacterales bacterium]|nr:hypothetical protein [Ktedonobacterales bacterium]
MQRQTRIWLVPQALVAVALGVVATLAVLAAGQMATVVALVVLFSLVSFALLGIARAVAVGQRFRFRRRWRFGRGSGPRGPDGGGWGGGDGGSGVREPRRPRWPFRPPRTATAEPEEATRAL